MAAIKQPIQDVMNRLATLQVVNADLLSVPLFVRVWNNQITYEENGELYISQKPAAYVEVVNNAGFDEIGIGFQSADLVFRIHLVHEFYNNDITFEQDLTIYDLRDAVVALMNLYQPTGCSPMFKKSEEADYRHKNVYHYIIDFITNFTDSKGSPYDPGAGKYVDSVPPVDEQTNVTIVTSLP